jgi:hypothetical protein
MAANSPTRIDDDLFEAAKAAAATQSRSAAQQVNHWARIGRQLEASGSVSQRDIARVLAGTHSYDALDPLSQAVVRTEWDEQMRAVRESLDFTAKLTAAGLPWAEADEAGQTVQRQSTHTKRKSTAKPPTNKGPVKQKAASPEQPKRRRTPRPAA